MKKSPPLLRRVFEHPLLPFGLALLAMLLSSPGLNIGWILDDQIHRAAFVDNERLPELVRSPVDLFAFMGPHWETMPGALPWWTSEDLHFAFSRPLSGISHWLDYLLWPEKPRWMHFHSLLWLGLVVWVGSLLFRRLAKPEERWVAGFAALLFALDDSHGTAAVWIANRNALLAMFFGLLTLLAYHLGRREGWRPGAVAAPLFLLLAVLAGEAAVACGAYLLSYALFLDRGTLKERLLALLPCAVVGILWRLAYTTLGYGVHGLGSYIDPAGEPLRFFHAALERVPILLWGQLSFPPADFLGFLSQSAAQQAWWGIVLLLSLFGGLLIPLLRSNPQARFWTFGLLLSLLPSCATLPSQRLLVYASLGGAGLLALFITHAWQGKDDRSTLGRVAARLLTLPLLLIHLLLGPISLWTASDGWLQLDSLITSAAATLPDEPAAREQQAVVVNTPTSFFTIYGPLYQALAGHPIPKETLTLATGIYPIEIHRPSPRALTVRPQGGFLPPPGTSPPGTEPPPFNIFYSFQAMDRSFYDGSPFQVGQRFQGLRIEGEIQTLTEDARPAEVLFRFATDLEDPSWRWLHWDNGGFVSWQLPAVGETVTLPSPSW